MSELELDRRQFLVTSGLITGGLVLGCATDPRASALPKARGGFAANAWLQITPDDQVIFQLDKVEMGQGVLTALSTILAEELEIGTVLVPAAAGVLGQFPGEVDAGGVLPRVAVFGQDGVVEAGVVDAQDGPVLARFPGEAVHAVS